MAITTPQLFDRICRLTLDRPSGFFKFVPNALQVTDMRVAFQITKNLDATPNTAAVQVFNLAEQTRAEFQRLPLHVTLEVGYDGDLRRLFSGDVRQAYTVKVGTDWATRFTCGDGDRAYREAWVDRSFRRGVTARDALREALSAMALAVPSDVAEFAELDKEYVSGLTLHGPAATEISRILTSVGLSWSIQDGALRILRPNAASNDEAVLIRGGDDSTGLVGSPEYGTPEKPGKKPNLSVRILIYPGLRPGGRVQLESARIHGTFRIERVQHTGDTGVGAQDWYTDLELKEVR